MNIRPLTRKEALRARALRRALITDTFGTDPLTLHFEAGYKAAMRDVRKILKECENEATGRDALDRIRREAICVRVKVRRFVRPLR